MNVHPCFAISFNGAGAANVDRNSRRASESDHRLSYCPGEFHFVRSEASSKEPTTSGCGSDSRRISALDIRTRLYVARVRRSYEKWSSDLEHRNRRIDNGEFVGGSPDEFPDRYNFASPIELLPLGLPQKLFHGTADTSVPHAMSVVYVRAAQPRGDEAESITLANAGHFGVVDPRTKGVRSCAPDRLVAGHPGDALTYNCKHEGKDSKNARGMEEGTHA